MIKSMTGYGKGELESSLGTLTVEIRSVNHRYGEVSIRMPRPFYPFENDIKRHISSVLKRGKIDVSVQWDETSDGEALPQINMELARQYHSIFKLLSDELHLANEIPLTLLLSQKGVIGEAATRQDDTGLQQHVLTAVGSAVTAIDAMRRREGESLADDLAARLKQVAEWIGEIRGRVPHTVDEYRQKLKARLAQLLENTEFDEWRLTQEIALMADRSDITEELVRLSSHFTQFEETLLLPEAVGRKLDFLMQEMNREVNTIGSKSNDVTITTLVVRVKAEMEKMREQVQNIE
ncbi:MAG TPA: YicC family protein [Desulfuromonadales bacterium]|nr:YicC family protein [Desulfuromonadales bacterium]